MSISVKRICCFRFGYVKREIIKIMLNMSKTKEIVFRRPCPVRFHLSPSFDNIEMVDHIKSLGVINSLSNINSILSSLLKQCSQRMYLLRLLRSQGLAANHLHSFSCHSCLPHTLCTTGLGSVPQCWTVW